MARSYRKLAQGQLLAVTAVLYTVPAGKQTIIRQIRLTNTDAAGAHQAFLFDGGVTAATAILQNQALIADATFVLDQVICMDSLATLQGKADLAAFVTYTIYGVEIG
jgi:hypothetical protein